MLIVDIIPIKYLAASMHVILSDSEESLLSCSKNSRLWPGDISV